jgi:hypothetical protein
MSESTTYSPDSDPEWSSPSEDDLTVHAASANRHIDRELQIPVYDPNNQYTVEQLEAEFPDWRNQSGDTDPELVALRYIRAKELMRIYEAQGLTQWHMGGSGLEWAIDHTPPEVGHEYDAHGIAGNDSVGSLDRLLSSGIDPGRKFYSMSFTHQVEAKGAIGAERPFTRGGFIIVAPRGQQLLESGISKVIVGEEYLPAFDLLRQRYPGVAFIPWHDAAECFTQEVNEAEGTSYQPLNTEEVPSYGNATSVSDQESAIPTVVPALSRDDQAPW